MKVNTKKWRNAEPKIEELSDIIGAQLHNSTREGQLEYVDDRLGKTANALTKLLTNLCERRLISLEEVLEVAGAQYEYNEVKEL